MLTRAFQKTLLAKAHSLKPVVQIGSNGLTPAVHEEIEVQLNKHELIKIKVATEDREEFSELANIITLEHQANCIKTIGRTIILYREKQDD